jgi:hypothetical protein
MKRKFVLPAVILCSVVIAAIMVFGNPLKVTDPADPRFNPDKFFFCDYKTHEDLRKAFANLFPVGTDQEFVDRVLIKAGRAYGYDDVNKVGLRIYRERQPFYQFKKPPLHLFIFNKQQKLLNIQINGAEKLYKDQPESKDLPLKKNNDDTKNIYWLI